MRRYERDVLVNRSLPVVFDFFADMTHIARWAPEDFISVTRLDEGPIELGSQFAFVTRGAQARSVFTWELFEPPRVLRFHGPRLNVGPGWVEGSGGYTFVESDGGTLVTAWYKPTLGGVLALMSPIARMRNVKLLRTQLARAKSMIEAVPEAKPQ
jgi:hypothetical protein